MIRPAKAADQSAVVGLMRDMHAAAQVPWRITFDAAYLAAFFDIHRLGGDRLCLIHEAEEKPRGFLFAQCGLHPFSPVPVASELLFWIDPAFRGGSAARRLISAFETWAKGKGCVGLGLAHQGGDDRPAILYRRLGYEAAETHYWKALS